MPQTVTYISSRRTIKPTAATSGVKRSWSSLDLPEKDLNNTTSYKKGSPKAKFQDDVVSPDGWDHMNRYGSFSCMIILLIPSGDESYHLVRDEIFKIGDHIFVNSEERPKDDTTDASDIETFIDESNLSLWVATVVEVRAYNAWSVWILVEWFYRPEDLPHGRQSYHGKNEIINSTQQDVVSALTVAGHGKVTYWEETNDMTNEIEGLFWRQTFDHINGKLSVSLLPPQCADN